MQKKNILARFPGLQLKGKLISVFVFISLIPTVVLVIVSLIVISQSIEPLERVSAELMKLLVLPLSDNALRIASDRDFVQMLDNEMDVSDIDYELPEGHILVIFDSSGKQVFTNVNESKPNMKLGSLMEAGLPRIDDALSWSGGVAIPEPIRLDDKQLVLSAVMCRSYDDGRPAGVVAVGKVVQSAIPDTASKTVIVVLVLTAVCVFLIAVWISSVIAREITNPIKKLVAGTREVATGDLDYQVDIQGSDEVGMLAESFNQMTVKLRQYANELRLAEKAAAWREIAQKLAHEVKNPLTPIQLSAERLRRRYYSNREGYENILDECTTTIVHEVDKLRRLLDEFSQLARMPRSNPVTSDINDIVNKALRLYAEFPENIEVVTEYAADLPTTSVDPDQMERAFFNIVKNAVEAMIDGGKLSVTTRNSFGSLSLQSSGDSQSSLIEIEFADTGTGVSADSMAKLFTPHFSTKTGGAGLGLAIVRKIVTDHSGEVTVKSEEGKGAVFTIKIPVVEGVENNG